MKKIFVLDTNVLLHDARAILGFGENDVCVPIYVFEEIDNFKKDLSELGRNAREVSRIIDGYRKLGNLSDGVQLETGGILSVLFAKNGLPPEFSVGHQMDNLIMAVAFDLKKANPDVPVVFVTKDTNLRIRADAIGLSAVDYDKGDFQINELYPGAAEFTISTDQVDVVYSGDTIPIENLGKEGAGDRLFPNEYILLRDETRPSRTVLARVTNTGESVEKIRSFKESFWGIRPRNMEQHYALDALLRPEIQLVTMMGKAGTGKTLLALAAGLHQTMDEDRYRKLLVSRPIFPLGKDLGYLPGDLEEKLKPWMQPIHDNVEFLATLASKGRKNQDTYKQLLESGSLEIEALTYIRGRSIPKQFLIVDEAQNLTPHEVKTVLTRAGEGTKLVFTGDPHQIDHPYVDSVNNGLTYIAQRFKTEGIAAHVLLSKGERSPLAEIAANLL